MYTKIHDRIWAMLNRKGVSTDGKLLYVYLFSCPHRTLIGIYKLPLSYIAEDMELSVQLVKKLMAELECKGLIEYDTSNSCVFIKKFLECNEIPNKNVEKKAAKIAASVIPGTDLWEPFLLEVAPYKEKFPNLFETILKRYCEQFGKPYAEQYDKWYGNTEDRKQNTEYRIQKAEAEDRSGSPAGAASAAAAAADDECDFLKALDDYHKKISPSMPSACEMLFRDYVSALSAAVVGKAVDKAVMSGVATWSYVNTILQDWRDKGINTAEKVEAEQERFRAGKRGATTAPGEADQRVREDMERMRAFMAREKGDGKQ